VIERELRTLVREAIAEATRAGDLTTSETPVFEVTQPQRREHGDWTTNAALVLQRLEGKPPRQIAETIVKHLPVRDWIRAVDIAGPGFINFHLSNIWLHETCVRALALGHRFGASDEGAGQAVNVEFVSANPNGPLTVGHGRHAAVGDSIARLLEFSGHKVTREYYFNDSGLQMDLFGQSVAARYLELLGRPAEVPEGGYQGGYVVDIAREIREEQGDSLAELSFEDLSARMRELAYVKMRASIERTLVRMGVSFDVWFNEGDLYESGRVTEAIERLREAGYVYEKDGAVWLASERLGDSRDRVLVRSIGPKLPTYLAPDLAYHLDKAARGFDRLIDIFGADHSGQVPSLEVALPVLGVDPSHLEFIIVQFVRLFRGGQAVSMGTRTGQFVTVDELVDEVGVDATRYTYLQTSVDHDVNFDIEEVKRQSMENPVYYVQYAHARIASILRHAAETGVSEEGKIVWDELHREAEVELMRTIASFEETVLVAARQRAPYRLTRYAEELARHFHRFYTECRVVTEDATLTRARLGLSRAAQQVLTNALDLLGVSAPERMDRADDVA
jgi:arginyl-tRNA synthetase